MDSSTGDDRPLLAVIGGTGLYTLERLQGELLETQQISTPYSPHPVAVEHYSIAGSSVLFLCRHGAGHKVPPHAINYKANMYALRLAGVSHVVAVNAVGGIHPVLEPRHLCIPDQVIDYTWGRSHTFHDQLETLSAHIDFTNPYSESLHDMLAKACRAAQVAHLDHGVYGCTQGPRLETAAEIRRMQQDGCDVVGQTGMPEAALARELEIEYASLCLVVNRAAGLAPGLLTMEEIGTHIAQGLDNVVSVLEKTISEFRDYSGDSAPSSGNS